MFNQNQAKGQNSQYGQQPMTSSYNQQQPGPYSQQPPYGQQQPPYGQQQPPYGQQQPPYGQQQPPYGQQQPPYGQQQPPYGQQQPPYGQQQPPYGQQQPPYGQQSQQPPYGQQQPPYGQQQPPYGQQQPPYGQQQPPFGSNPKIQVISRGNGISEKEFQDITNACIEVQDSRAVPMANKCIQKIKQKVRGEWYVFVCPESEKNFDFFLSFVDGGKFVTFKYGPNEFHVCGISS
jgi:hypothetical protein